MRLFSLATSLLVLAGASACTATTPQQQQLQAATGSARVTTASGIVFEALRNGAGRTPGPRDTVRVHYRGTLDDGREFDSSYRRGQPAQFQLDRVIGCWQEGVQLMRPGGKAKLTCPPATAYGRAGIPNVIPPNATLQFEVELLDVVGR